MNTYKVTGIEKIKRDGTFVVVLDLGFNRTTIEELRPSFLDYVKEKSAAFGIIDYVRFLLSNATEMSVRVEEGKVEFLIDGISVSSILLEKSMITSYTTDNLTPK